MSPAADTVSRGQPARGFRLLLVQGSAVKLASALASAVVVLPFLCTALGGSLVVAGLLVPLSTVGTIQGNAIGPPMMRRRWGNRSWVVTSTLLSAVVVVLAVGGLGLGDGPRPGPVVVSAVFAGPAVTGGAVAGLGGLAFSDLIGVALPRYRRSSLLFSRSALGGVLAVAVALVTSRVFAGRDPLNRSPRPAVGSRAGPRRGHPVVPVRGTDSRPGGGATHFDGAELIETHGVVLLLATLAAQSVTVGRRAYLLGRCPVADRPTLFSFARIAVGSLGGLLAAVIGALAEVHGAVWPTVVLNGLNIVAVVAAPLAPRPGSVEGDDDPSSDDKTVDAPGAA